MHGFDNQRLTRSDAPEIFEVRVKKHFFANRAITVISPTTPVEKGGSIQGVARQRVESGLDASEITALASEGYEFIGWDDGISEPSRTDKEISEDKTQPVK